MRHIELQGVRVHNLKNIDLRLPLQKLIVVTGVSGSGKSSLAFDTLYAEGQRRYIETFSPYARQFLDQMERPDADRIENIPPAIAIRQSSVNLNARSTVATATEIHDYLRLLLARVGEIRCPGCGKQITNHTPESILETIRTLPDGTRFQICFEGSQTDDERPDELLRQLGEDGFHRAIIGDRTVTLDGSTAFEFSPEMVLLVVVDRLSAGKSEDQRIIDSLELAFRFGNDRCVLLNESIEIAGQTDQIQTDGRDWFVSRFNGLLSCDQCQLEFIEPEPRLFSFNSALGACPECEGFGAVPAISFDKVVPDPSKTLRDGAIVPWTTPAYVHELDELLALADDYGIPTDIPFSELRPEHLELIRDGVPERDFGGLQGFYRWLDRHRYKVSVRIFLNRWRTYEDCPSCHGDRLQPLALAVGLPAIPESSGTQPAARCNLAQLCRMSIAESAGYFDSFRQSIDESSRIVAKPVLDEIQSRLGYLLQVGLGYLTLDRKMRTLSGGEAQRVALTSTLGSNLVNTLYVLDEPSAGLHARDSERVIGAIRDLQAVGNTVVVVEHEDAFVQSADHVVDIGPEAGKNGGEVIFDGSVDELLKCESSTTARFLNRAQADGLQESDRQRGPKPQWLTLTGARQHSLKNLTVRFPLGMLCVVTGVSGSGKSTLVEKTLYPALCRQLKLPCNIEFRGEFDTLDGFEEIDDVILADQTPIGRTPRSIPVTYMKAFDEIRKLFAQTSDARLRNFTATQFSFNASGGGKCQKCEGSGSIEIDMQFMANLSMTCPECHGTRFHREIREIKYRGLSIDEVLGMTAAEAFAFFRGQPKIQRRLNFLKEVGLDYLPLGQAATTLSGGESQRLKLASFLASGSKSRTLFLLNEPTIGLHSADVATLLRCFESLLSVGHSLIVIEHNLDVIAAADHIIDLGPEAGHDGGELVVAGPPEAVAECPDSITGRFLVLRQG